MPYIIGGIVFLWIVGLIIEYWDIIVKFIGIGLVIIVVLAALGHILQYREKEQARQKEEEEKRIKERELNYSNAKKEVLNFIDNYN